ncbi:MAG: extracellular solute-binding protein [Beijerinckiaceae bacterium]|jgi:ABC-type Fe3+ transport system substrate-binding protein|nr:extracellular solute-binding protein [Beijerinckiaceae bacterium]
MRASFLRILLLAGLLLAFGRPSLAREEIVVITSFPASLYEPFRRAFEAREPDLRLRILNRKTTAAIAMVAGGRFEADVFWASAPDAFEVLREAGKLLPISPGLPPVSPRIGGFPVDARDGTFRGFSVSGYGMMWHRPSLERAGLAPPRAIADLTDPRYRGLIAMSAPSRSGTTHLMVETVLQRHGWRKGWEIWLRLAGNLATVTARSFSVPSGVAQGRFAIGLSIDFLGRSGTGELGFAYPAENVFLPASIAVLSTAQNPEGARRFAAFVLSEAGQKLLAEPRINRHPVAAGMAAPDRENLFALADSAQTGFVFDAALSGRRYELVNILFDELITERLVRLQKFWRLHAEIREKAQADANLAREWQVVGELAANLPRLLATIEDDPAATELKRVPRGVPLPPVQAALVERIRQNAEASLAHAEARLDVLARRLNPESVGLRP